MYYLEQDKNEENACDCKCTAFARLWMASGLLCRVQG